MSDAKEQRIAELPLFAGADDKVIRHLASAADEVSIPAGRDIIVQGRDQRDIYVIEKGTASVLIDGREVAEIPAGEMFGELGFFVHELASATVASKTDMTVLVIPYNRFDLVLDENPRLVRAIASELAERLYRTDARLH